MTALPSTRELRALDVVEVVPAGCFGLLVTRRTWSPHLQPGELAVIDATDRTHQAGELFALAVLTIDGLRLRIVQATRSAPDAPGFRLAPRGFREALSPAGWVGKCRGRVVGVIASSGT